MAAKFRKNSKVQWKWAGRLIDGKVEQIYTESVTKKIKTATITRHGSKEKPAYLVKAASGNFALKLETELQAPAKPVAGQRAKRKDV